MIRTWPPVPVKAGLYGVDACSGGLVVWDRWGQDTFNSVTLGSSAASSFVTKLEVLRSLQPHPHSPLAGRADVVQVFIVDTGDEYRRFAGEVGGSVVRLGAPGVRVNPFDLPPGAHRVADALTRRVLFIHTLVAALLGVGLSPQETAVLDRSVIATYARAGITADRRTWSRPAPVLADLAAVLAADTTDTGDPTGAEFAARLAPYVSGVGAGLFTGPTTVSLDGLVVAFSLREVPDEFASVAALLALDAVWSRILTSRQRGRRLVVVDEVWPLLARPEAATFLYRLARRARTHETGVAILSRDPGDVLANMAGQAIAATASTQMLVRQSPHTIDTVGDAFELTADDRAHLVNADPGDAVLISGSRHIVVRVLASPAETVLTTNPHPPSDEPTPERDGLR